MSGPLCGPWGHNVPICGSLEVYRGIQGCLEVGVHMGMKEEMGTSIGWRTPHPVVVVRGEFENMIGP